MKRQKGFTLIELLIVVAVLGIIAAIAIPSLKKARQAANGASATSSLRTVITAQHLYFQKFNIYGTLAQLMPEGTLDPHLGSGNKSNYSFAITLGAGAKTWSCTATPQEAPSSLIHYFADYTGVIRFNAGSPADATSDPIPK